MNALSGLQAYNKAVAALLVGFLVLALKHFNFPVDQGLQDALGVVVLALLVFFVPNKPAVK